MAKKKKQSSNRLEVQNAAKTLYANIRFMSPDEPIRSLVITSTVPNEGKSTVSIELARAIATSGKRVLLVEADMRRRTLADALNLRPRVGLYAVLTEDAQIKDAIVEADVPNMFFLDVEPSIPNPADILSSKRYRKLATTLEQDFDYVIFDTPPVGTFVDAAILSTIVDGTVLVVRSNVPNRSELLHAYDQLKKAEANVIGICATFCESSSSEYYYAYYTKDGKRASDEDIQAAHDQQQAAASVKELPDRTGSFEPISDKKPGPHSHRRPSRPSTPTPSGRRPSGGPNDRAARTHR